MSDVWGGTGLASRPWLIVPVCAAIHATYAVGFLINNAVGSITALHLLHLIVGPFLSFVLLLVAATAVLPMFVRLQATRVQLCLWPQQAVLFLMAASALLAAFSERFPDGVERSFSFIFSDQCWAVYLAIGHLAATLRNARLGRYGNGHGRIC